MSKKISNTERGKIEIDIFNVKCYLGKGPYAILSEELFNTYKMDVPTKEEDYFYLDKEEYLILYPIPEKKISIIDNNGDKYKATVYFIDDIKNIIQGLNISNPHYLKDGKYIKMENEVSYSLFLFGQKSKEIKDIKKEEINFESLKMEYNSQVSNKSSLKLKDINKNISHYSAINNIEQDEYFLSFKRIYQEIELGEFCKDERRDAIEDIIYGIIGNYACGISTFLIYFNYICEFPSIYLNLKILKNAFKTEGFQNLLNSELMFLFRKLKKSFDEYKSFIEHFLPYEEQDFQLLILSIVDKLKSNKIIMIFDQYKDELFPNKNFIQKLKSKLFENESKFKVIIASSINDGNIRAAYFALTFNIINLEDEKTKNDNKTNNYIPYHFVEKMIDDNQIKNIIKNKIYNSNNDNNNKDIIINNNEDKIKFENKLKLFNYLPLYYNLCIQFKDNLDNFEQKTKEKIEEKITKFFDKAKVGFINLDEIRKMIDNEVSQRTIKCYYNSIPFKYFYIEKINDKFILRTHFPLIKEILIHIIMKQTVNLFDGEIKYNDSIISSLMELNLIINIKNKNIPLDIDSFCKVDEISEFNELIEKDTEDFKDKNIFITQNKQNGTSFDLAYFNGKKTNCKKLVYIQVKKSLSKNKVDMEQTKKIFREKSKKFLELFNIEPDDFNLVYITLINNNIKESIIAYDNYKKHTTKNTSDLEINSIVYSINSLESFCYENCIQLYYYEPKTHKFYIKAENDFINSELDLLKENKSDLPIIFNHNYLYQKIEDSKKVCEDINSRYKTFLNKKTKRKSEKFFYKVGGFDFNILFDFTEDYFVNTNIIKYIDLQKAHFDMRIDGQSSKNAIVCFKLNNQKGYKIDSLIYSNCKFKIENNILIKSNNTKIDRDNDLVIIIQFDSVKENLKVLVQK